MPVPLAAPVRRTASAGSTVTTRRRPAPGSRRPGAARVDTDTAIRPAPGTALDVLPSGTPEVVGGVRLLRLLGRGGMGEVYLGRHEALDIDVAVKLVHAHAADPERFVTEARVAARIVHPHVVRVLNAGTDHGRPYLVMELLRGGDLAQLVRDSGRLPWRRAVELAAQVGEGLGAAHQLGIVHRDVKPANCMLTEDGQVKLTDLGLARRSDAPGDHSQTGVVLGTPAYMAPEQAIDIRRAGAAADVYALGATLWHLLTGTMPFRGESTTQLLLAHINQPPPDLRTAVPDVPPALAALVARMLAKEPERRPVDGAAAAAELRGLLAAIPVPPQSLAETRRCRAMAPSRGRRRALALSSLGALLAAVVWSATLPHADAGTDRRGPGPARAAHAAVAPPVAPAAAGVDAWRTPPRATFVVAEDVGAGGVGAGVVHALESALRGTGLRLLDRAHLDAALREHGLVEQGRVDRATAPQLGRMVGGHIYLTAERVADQIALGVVVVETGERLAGALVDEAKAGEQAAALAADAAARLPLRARLIAGQGAVRHALDAGRQHGVRVGDRFRVLSGTPDEPGAELAIATVTAVTADQAEVQLPAGGPGVPALVERILP